MFQTINTMDMVNRGSDDETKMIHHDSDISDVDFDNDDKLLQKSTKNEESSSNNETKLMLK